MEKWIYLANAILWLLIGLAIVIGVLTGFWERYFADAVKSSLRRAREPLKEELRAIQLMAKALESRIARLEEELERSGESFAEGGK